MKNLFVSFITCLAIFYCANAFAVGCDQEYHAPIALNFPGSIQTEKTIMSGPIWGCPQLQIPQRVRQIDVGINFGILLGGSIGIWFNTKGPYTLLPDLYHPRPDVLSFRFFGPLEHLPNGCDQQVSGRLDLYLSQDQFQGQRLLGVVNFKLHLSHLTNLNLCDFQF